MNSFEEGKIRVLPDRTTTRIGENFNITISLSNDFGFVNEIYVIMNQQGGRNEKRLKMEYVKTVDNFSYFKTSINFENVGLHYYCFEVTINNTKTWIKCNPQNNKQACFTNEKFPYWSITVYEADFVVPGWAKGKIMYHIMVDRFNKSLEYTPEKMKNRITINWGEMPIWSPNEKGKILNNDFFMGNLKGIEEKLQYLYDLGVEILYLSPICMSQSNHRYDTADYEVVDPYLGENSDLLKLCNSAHKLGMKVIIDAVFNHTGNDSKYFNEYGTYDTIGAVKGKKSPYYNWYRKNSKGEFEYWWGFKNLPVCDGYNKEWQNYIYGKDGVIDKWFSLGIDGLRLDVADELTDEFIENIRIAVKRNKQDGFILGEVWDNAITKEGYGKQRTYLLGKGLDSVMNYPFTNAILKYVRFGNYEYFEKIIEEITTQYPKEVIFSLMNSLSTHDITRALTTLVAEGIPNNKYNWIWDVPYGRNWQFDRDILSLDNYKKAKNMLQVATAIQYFLPGNPCIFYGDEVGLYGYKDPFNRKCFPWDNIDEELLNFFKDLGNLRKKLQFINRADIQILKIDKDILMFERFTEENKVLIVVNRTDKNIELENILKNYSYESGKILFEKNSTKQYISNYGIIIISK